MSAVSIRFGLCPFCDYIGPPLFCGCVTELHDALHALLRGHLEQDGVAKADAALDRHKERIRVINEELQRERET